MIDQNSRWPFFTVGELTAEWEKARMEFEREYITRPQDFACFGCQYDDNGKRCTHPDNKPETPWQYPIKWHDQACRPEEADHAD